MYLEPLIITNDRTNQSNVMLYVCCILIARLWLQWSLDKNLYKLFLDFKYWSHIFITECCCCWFLILYLIRFLHDLMKTTETIWIIGYWLSYWTHRKEQLKPWIICEISLELEDYCYFCEVHALWSNTVKLVFFVAVNRHENFQPILGLFMPFSGFFHEESFSCLD